MRLGGGELVIILIIVFIIVGPDRITGVMKSMGKGLGLFKKGLKEATQDMDEDSAAQPAKPKKPEQGPVK